MIRQPRPVEQAHCGDKRRYTSQQEAQRTVKRVNVRIHYPLNEYRCRFCGWWHIGHKGR